MSEQTESVSEAQAQLAEAEARVRREESLEKLRARPGLAYVSVAEEGLGPFLVAVDGAVLGEVRSDQQTAVQGWYAVSYNGDRQCEPAGPYLTVRAAAVSMMR